MNARHNRRALRDIKITYENLARADGSARFCSGDIASLATVSGPIEVRLTAEQASQATFEVSTRPVSHVPATEAKSHALAIRSALLPSLILNNHPRSLIQLVVQALVSPRTQWKDPLLASMINASSLALMNAGSVPMRGVVCAVAIGRLPEIGLVVDPSEEECAELNAGGCFAFLFAEGIGSCIESVWTTWRSKSGTFDEKDFNHARSLAKGAAQTIYTTFKSSVPYMGMTEPFEFAAKTYFESDDKMEI